ncbi:MAG TPA: PAS domain S-box protein [Armatimonadota bacterium]
MTQILLLLAQPADRQALVSVLSPCFDVSIPAADVPALAEPFDLCLIDSPMLERFDDALQARKTAEAPYFLPIMLLVPQTDMRRLTPHVWEHVDEVLPIPTDMPRLSARLHLLLRTRQLQQELHESESLFRSLADNANAVIGIVQGTKFVYVNAYFTHLSGYSLQELLAMDIQQLIAPQNRALVRERARLRQDGTPALPSRYEFAFLTKDGQERWLDFAAALIDYHGKPAIIGIAYDITERKQGEEERQRLLAELDAIFSAIGDPILLFDTTATILRANTAATSLAGQEMCGRTHAELIHALCIRLTDGRPVREDESPVIRATRGEVVMNEPLRVTNAQGQEFMMLVSANPLWRDARLWGVVSYWHDITERARLLAEVERRVAEMDATLNAIADGLIVYDPHGAVIRVNAVARRYLGATSAQQNLTDLDRAIHQRLRHPNGTPLPEEALPVARALQGEQIANEIMVLQQAEQSHWLSTSAAPIIDVDGHLLGAVVSFANITPLHDLQQRQEDYLRTISHDLRNPLSVISGHAGLLANALRAQCPDEHLLFSVAAIQRSSQRMNAMIEDLVDAARQEGGQLALQQEAVDVRRYLLDLLQRNAETMDVARISLDIADDLPAVWADYNRLERIIANLLSNAQKYSEPGTPVTVAAYQTAEHTVEIAVSDQGPGIPPEDLPHIFERFYRAKWARKTEGIGLGLYITRMLVEAHGGRIRVESAVGKGSTFFVSLPMA